MTTSVSDAGVLFADASVQPSAAANQIQTIAATVAANALTVGLTAGALAFRSNSLASGVITALNATAVSLTVPSTATLGTVSAVQSRLVILAINNAGVVEPAITNITGGLQLDETNLISTTAISAAATANNIIYSSTARTNVAYRVVGFIDITEATAGTWATAPSVIQGIGGLSLKAVSSKAMVRLNTANGYGSTNTKIRRFTNTVTSQGTDITYADSVTLGATFTINTSDVYSISFSDSYSSVADIGLSLNTTQPTVIIASIPVGEILSTTTSGGVNFSVSCGWTGYLVAGSIVRAHTQGITTGTVTAATQFTISRLS